MTREDGIVSDEGIPTEEGARLAIHRIIPDAEARGDGHGRHILRTSSGACGDICSGRGMRGKGRRSLEINSQTVRFPGEPQGKAELIGVNGTIEAIALSTPSLIRTKNRT
jgi:hypothetical protein